MKEKKAKEILEDLKKTYNNIADEFSNTRNISVKDFDFLTKYIKKNSRIVDLGCGNGRFFGFLDKINKNIPSYKYIGIDNNENFIKICKKKYPNAQFSTGNLTKLPLNDNSVDFLGSFRTFHHLPSKKMRLESLNEIKRVLKKDGILIISVWNLWQIKYIKQLIFALFRSIITLGNYSYKDTYIPWNKKNKRYYHAFTKSEIKSLLKKSNFKLIELFQKKHDYIIIAKND